MLIKISHYIRKKTPALYIFLIKIYRKFVTRFLIKFKSLSKTAILAGAMQKEKELSGLIDLLKNRKLTNVLEIGTAKGGTLLAWCKVATDDAHIISLDLPGGDFGGGYDSRYTALYRSYGKRKQIISFLRGNSHEKTNFEKAKALLKNQQLDFLFIDGDHSYLGVKRDFNIYSNLVKKGGVIAFHDICVHKNTSCEVDKFWDEIKRKYKYYEFIDNQDTTWGGIGAIIKP